MAFTQLNPPMPVHAFDKGGGLASAGASSDLGDGNGRWGELWCTPNPKLRLQTDSTMGQNTVLQAV